MSGVFSLIYISFQKKWAFLTLMYWDDVLYWFSIAHNHFYIYTSPKNDVSISNIIATIETDLSNGLNIFTIIFFLSLLILSSSCIYLLIMKQNKKLADKTKLLEEKNAQLEKLNLTKDKVFSIIAHDLKGPIGNISKLLEVMLEEKEMRDDETIEMLKRSSENTYTLLDSMLTWARGQRGDIDYKPIKINLHAICNYPLGILALQASNKHIMLTNNVPEQLYAYADVYLLRTVLRNIISNSIKYTGNGGSIIISAFKADHNTIQIDVNDNGVGIEEARLATLFEPVKNKNTKGTAGERGTGLGLLITLEFVELNKGRIWATSKVGQGTTFSFTVPYAN